MNEIIKSEETQGIFRTANLIAAEINDIKEHTRKMVLYNSIEIGRRLVEAKQLVPHGEWSEWLEKSVDYSKSTANNLMRIFEEYGSEQLTLLGNNAKSQALGNLSYTQAITLLGVPEDERESFVKEHNIDNMSTRELQKAVKEREQAIKEKEELENKLKVAEKKATEEKEKHSKQTEKLKKELAAIESKNKEELTNKEVEITNLTIHIEDINKKLKEAEASGNNEEAEELRESLKNSENELMNAKDKIAELEEQLKDKPIDVAVEEKIPEEIEKELIELREKVSQQAKEKDSEAVIEFKIICKKTIEQIRELLGSLAEIKNISEDEYEKYKGAVKGLLNKMLESL